MSDSLDGGPRKRLEPWPLDYSWASRGGVWTVQADVLLEGILELENPTGEQLEALFSGFTADVQRLDTESRSGYWNGGVFCYYRADPEPSERESTRGSICLHARGEDAFDSLHHLSALLCRRMMQWSQVPRSLRWIEHPHNRGYRRLLLRG